MKFSDYLETENIENPEDLNEEKIEGDSKLYKKMKDLGKKVQAFKAKGGDRFSEEGMKLGAAYAKAMYDYMMSNYTLVNGKDVKESLNEGDKEKSINNVVKALKKIKSEAQKVSKDAVLVYNEVFGGEPDKEAGLYCEIFNISDGEYTIQDIIDSVEDYE